MSEHPSIRFLHLEDSEVDAELIAHTIRRELPDCRIDRVRSRPEFRRALGQCAYDLILVDYQLENYDGLSAFDLAHELCPELPVIFVSGAIGEEKAIEAMKRGAADYLMKDRPGRLVPAVRQALVLSRERRLRRQNEAEVQATARLSQLLVRLASELFVGGADITSFKSVWKRICAGVGAEGFVYATLGDNGGVVQVEMSDGPAAELVEDHLRRDGARHLGRAADTTFFVIRPEEVETGVADPATGLAGRGIGWVGCQLLRFGGQPLGMLMLTFSSRGSLTPGELDFLQIAADLVAAHVERNRLMEEVRRALHAEQEANRAKDDFVAALSHELRTPLNPVLLLASDAQARAHLPPELRATFETIVDHVKLETRLIDDLLDFTRLARQEIRLRWEDVHVIHCLDSAQRLLAPQIQAKRIRLERRNTASFDLVRGEAARLQQVFWKLLANAVETTPEDGRIEVRTSTRDGHVIIEVEDSGAGLPSDTLERMFTPLTREERAVSTAVAQSGLGIGLTMARHLVDLHGGVLRASSRVAGGGTTFAVEMPLTNQGPAGHVGPASTADAGAQGRTTVLLIEDHESTRTALMALLGRRGYRVVSAATAAEARARAQDTAIDLVLSDIGLPDGNGFDLMSELHRNHGLRGIAITGFEIAATVENLQAAGFLALLKKPLMTGPLLETITGALLRLRA